MLDASAVMSNVNLTLPIQPAEPKPIQKTKASPSIGRPPRGKSHRQSKPPSPMRKEVRRRNKAHLGFVAAQPCLVCQRTPCDAHHLKFAQPRSLGRKVSDEFTVPLCRDHHRDLHRFGNELAWWANLQIAPIEIAKDLWQTRMLDPTVARKTSPRSPDGPSRFSGRSPDGCGPYRSRRVLVGNLTVPAPEN